MIAASPAATERAAARRTLRAALACLALGLACAAREAPPPPGEWAAPGPSRPADCRAVSGGDLQAALDAAPDGASLCLAPGVYAGPVTIERGLALWGPPDAVIRSSGEGTTVRLRGAGAALLGLGVDGSGGRFELLDAAVHVSGEGARVEGVRIRNAVFGILVERASGALVRDNEVVGDPETPFGLRGDAIRLWEVYDSRVEHNLVRDGRDVVLWYSSRNQVYRNRVQGGRYGAHLMFSHATELRANEFVGNVTGLFVMYSRDAQIVDNVFADSRGAAGIGLGLKESGNLHISGNQLIHNNTGLYVDTSPLWPDDRNVISGNQFRLNSVGVSFLGRAEGNELRGNVFRDNQTQVAVDGRGDAREASWSGNEFDDYAGYDLDGDGIGDLPYELRSLSSDLVAEAPALAFFRGTPALALAEAIGRIVPLFEPRLILVDPAPRLAPGPLQASRAD